MFRQETDVKTDWLDHMSRHVTDALKQNKLSFDN